MRVNVAELNSTCNGNYPKARGPWTKQDAAAYRILEKIPLPEVDLLAERLREFTAPTDRFAALSAALYYHEHECFVVPLCTMTPEGQCTFPHAHTSEKSIGKVPILGAGWQHARLSREDIITWWTQYPTANVGVLLEPSGLIVVDLDSQEATEEASGKGWAPGPQVRTGRGVQHYFRNPKKIVGLTIKQGTSRAIDVLSKGHVVGFNSVHRSGKPYQLLTSWEEWPLEEPPRWAEQLLLDSLTAKSEAVEIPDDLPTVDLGTLNVSDSIKHLIRTGEAPARTKPYDDRSNPLHFVVMSLVEVGHDDATIASILLDDRFKISAKPRAQGARWVASEIGRARAKAHAGAASSPGDTRQEGASQQSDPLLYLSTLDDKLSPSDCLKHYQVLKPSLLRLRSEDRATLDIAVREIVKKLGIKAKTVRDDLTVFAEPPAEKEACDLLEKIGQTRALRLAQDYQEGKLWFGIVASEDRLFVTSDRELLTLDKVPEGFTVADNGFDLCRFSKDGIVRFLAGADETGSALLTDLRAFFLRFAVFRDKRIALLLAVWTLGTYCYRVFRVYPYLALRSPAKRCGKSRVLDLLSLVAFNASSRVVHPTEAQLFRGPSRNGGTLLLDEVEALGRTDKDAYKGLLSILNSGFEQNGTVERQAKDALGNFHGVNFETYCPRALAGINKTTDTLEDRSIVLMMQRKLAREKTKRFSPSRLEAEAQALRDRCYSWALTHAADLAEVYDQADKSFSALDSLDDRARDLWEPLASMTAVADVERDDNEKTLTDELTALACDLSQVRDGAAEDSTTGQVVTALQSMLAQKRKEVLFQHSEEVTLPPTELATLLKAQLGWEKLSTKTLATLLNPLDLYSNQVRKGKEVVRAYTLSPDFLAELSDRYAQNSPKSDEK